MTAWIVRAGVNGERDTWSLDGGIAGGGFHEVENLAEHETREQIARAVGSGFPSDSHPGRLAI